MQGWVRVYLRPLVIYAIQANTTIPMQFFSWFSSYYYYYSYLNKYIYRLATSIYKSISEFLISLLSVGFYFYVYIYVLKNQCCQSICHRKFFKNQKIHPLNQAFFAIITWYPPSRHALQVPSKIPLCIISPTDSTKKLHTYRGIHLNTMTAHHAIQAQHLI